jgi:ribosomal protein L3
VIGTGKGRGYGGVMNRYNFGRLPTSDETKKVQRSHGSVGLPAGPARSAAPATLQLTIFPLFHAS